MQLNNNFIESGKSVTTDIPLIQLVLYCIEYSIPIFDGTVLNIDKFPIAFDVKLHQIVNELCEKWMEDGLLVIDYRGVKTMKDSRTRLLQPMFVTKQINGEFDIDVYRKLFPTGCKGNKELCRINALSIMGMYGVDFNDITRATKVYLNQLSGSCFKAHNFLWKIEEGKPAYAPIEEFLFAKIKKQSFNKMG